MTNLKFFLESFWLMKRSKNVNLFLLFRGTNHPRVKPLSKLRKIRGWHRDYFAPSWRSRGFFFLKRCRKKKGKKEYD